MRQAQKLCNSTLLQPPPVHFQHRASRAAFVPSSKRKKIRSTNSSITSFPPLQHHQSPQLTNTINALITESTTVMKGERERQIWHCSGCSAITEYWGWWSQIWIPQNFEREVLENTYGRFWYKSTYGIFVIHMYPLYYNNECMFYKNTHFLY
jgi:hypothetical protein